MKKIFFSIFSIVIILVILVFSIRIYNDYKYKDINVLDISDKNGVYIIKEILREQ